MYEVLSQSIPYSELNTRISQAKLQSPIGIAMAVAKGRRPDIKRIPIGCPKSIM